jgi:hypothetical protein
MKNIKLMGCQNFLNGEARKFMQLTKILQMKISNSSIKKVAYLESSNIKFNRFIIIGRSSSSIYLAINSDCTFLSNFLIFKTQI